MARLPIPGSDEGTWGDLLNDYLAQVHNGDGTLKDNTVTPAALAPNAVTSQGIQDGSITEVKLDSSVQAKLNTAGSGGVADGTITTAKLADGSVTSAKILDGTIVEADLATAVQTKLNTTAPVSSVAGKTGVVTLVKADVGLANVDNTADVNKPVSTATQTALSGKANTTHGHLIADVTGLQTALDGKQVAGSYATSTDLSNGLATKANTTHAHAVADVTGLQTALDGKQAAGSYATSTDLTNGLATKANSSHTHTASQVTDFTEATQDVIGSTLAAGTNVSLNYDDAAGTMTISATPGAGVTDLSTTTSSTDVTVVSSTGADATITSASTSNAGVLSAADKTKLNSVASGATANATDAQLRDRSTHIGTQAAATISDFNSVSDGRIAAAVGVSVQAYSAGLSGWAGKTAPTGTVVGTSDAQTLTNKTLTTPAISSPTGLVKADVGLGNVDNTSDANKPVSSATQTALNTKEATLVAGTTSQYYRGDKSWQTLDKTAVGLSNVDNTSDANKPISTATQTALNLKADATSVGAKVMVYNAYADAPALPVNTVVVSITGS